MVQDQPYKSGIDWIDNHASVIAISAPLAEDAQDLDDNLVFEELEGEMMKRGTLAHNSIRWDFVLEQTTMLLREGRKDLRLLTFLIYSLPQLSHTPSLPAPLPLAAHLVNAFISQWLAVATPQGRARERAISRLLDALDALVKKAEENGLEVQYLSCITEALEQAAQILTKDAAENANQNKNSSGEKLASFVRRLDNIVAEEVMEAPAPPVPSTEKSAVRSNSKSQTSAAIATASAPRPGDLLLDSGNERALRESLAKMADFLFDIDPDQPLSYRLRRYASWYGMREQPALKNDNITIIMPPAEEALDLYRQAVLQKNTDIDIVKRLERSCYLQPFWIEGHYLGWQLARLRKAERVVNAIFEEVSQFVKSVAWLDKLQFMDKTPFMPDNVRSWLANPQHTGQSAEIGEIASNDEQKNPQDNVVAQARKLAQAGDIMGACAALETPAAPLTDLRARTLWEVTTLELLSEWGMKTHVGLTAARLEEAVRTLSVAEWDGSVLERLHRLKSVAL